VSPPGDVDLGNCPLVDLSKQCSLLALGMRT
jgi:hypothetical protein